MSTEEVANAKTAEENDHEEEDDDDAELAGYGKKLISRLLALRQIQKEHDLIDEQYKAERLALEKKFFDERKPLLEKRHNIVSGAVEVVVPAEIEAVDSKKDGAEEEEEEEGKGVEGFWLQCIQNHPHLGGMLAEADYEVLEKLNNITCEYNENWSGFTLNFHFDENDFFTNSVLTKKYVVEPDLLDDVSPALSEIDGCDINWKPKKNITVKEIQKKQKAKSGKHKGQTRVVTSTEPQHSFFNWFKDPTEHGEDGEDDEDEEEGGEGKISFSFDEDYEAAHAFRTELIPSAIFWFTGEAAGDDDDDDFDLEEDDDEDEDDVNDDDDEPDEVAEEDDDDHKKGGKGGKKNKGHQNASGAAGQQPECKQS